MNKLWSNLDEDSVYQTDKQLYQQHLLEQYKMYADTTDRVSARRDSANVFFLSLHSSVLGLVGFSIEKLGTIYPKWILLFPLVALLTVCYTWKRLLTSYKQLNAAKFEVIGQFEEKLPSSPYVKAEWVELGEGKDPKKYRPLTDLERIIPWMFAGLYIGLFLFLFAS